MKNRYQNINAPLYIEMFGFTYKRMPGPRKEFGHARNLVELATRIDSQEKWARDAANVEARSFRKRASLRQRKLQRILQQLRKG